MKKLLLLFTILAMFIVSCGGAKEESKKEETKTLIVGTNAEYSPFEFKKDGKITGFDYDLMEEIAKDTGIKIQWQEMSFDGLIPALKAGKIQAIISGMTATEEREKAVDFTDVYYVSNQAYVKLKGDTSLTKREDMNGKSVGAQLGSIQEMDAKTITGAKVVVNESVPNLIMQLNGKKVNAVVLEDVVALNYMKENPNIEVFATQPIEGGLAIAFDKDKNKELIAKINETIKKMKADGRYDKLIAKYELNLKK